MPDLQTFQAAHIPTLTKKQPENDFQAAFLPLAQRPSIFRKFPRLPIRRAQRNHQPRHQRRVSKRHRRLRNPIACAIRRMRVFRNAPNFRHHRLPILRQQSKFHHRIHAPAIALAKRTQQQRQPEK